MSISVVVPGAVDRLAFDQFMSEVLIPTLVPGQIVVLDNLSVHRRVTVQAALTAAGCELWFLPRSSPDRNPIEQAFAKLKPGLRRAGARTFEAVVEAVGIGNQAITSQDAASFVQAAGYSL